jgi:predicted RNA-binding Zn ribbon-like protein
MVIPGETDALGLAVGLVNTWDELEDPPEIIRDVPQIARWLRLHDEPGVDEIAERLTPADLERLKRARPRLRAAFEARSERKAVDVLNELLRETKAVPQLSSETGRWEYAVPSGRASDAIVALSAMGLLEAMRDGAWRRFGICHGDPCRCVYVDRSKNRSRTYCSQACADRLNAAAYRRRKAARR